MRKPIVVTTLLALAVGIAVIGAVKARKGFGDINASAAGSSPFTAAAAAAARTVEMPQDRPGTIDGARNPELVPDRVAYSLIFRLIADRKTEEERQRIRPYIRGLLGIKCPKCGPPEPETGRTVEMDEADIDAVIAVAEEFHRRVSVLDQKVEEIKWRSWPDPSPKAMNQLRAMQAQKDAIVMQLAASMTGRLTAGSRAVFHQRFNEHIKRRIKIAPEPQSQRDEMEFDLHPGGKDDIVIQ